MTANNGTVTVYAVAAAAGVGFAASSKDDAQQPAGAQQQADGEEAKGFTLKGDVDAKAEATGLSSGDGADHVTNAATLTVNAIAATLTAGGASVETKDTASASAKSTSTCQP